MRFKTINCIVLMTNETEKRKLNCFLSNAGTINVISLKKTPLEAIDVLRNFKSEILFVDTTFDYLLQNIYHPPFVVGIVQDSPIENLSNLLEKGFFDVITLPLDEKKVMNILCKIFNIHNFYSCNTELAELVEEERTIYNKEQIINSICNKDYMFIPGNHKNGTLKIYYNEIIFINNVGNEIRLNLENGVIRYVRTSLSSFLKKLPETQFVRVNRSIIVNLDKISEIKQKKVNLEKFSFTISRSYYKKFMKNLNM